MENRSSTYSLSGGGDFSPPNTSHPVVAVPKVPGNFSRLSIRQLFYGGSSVSPPSGRFKTSKKDRSIRVRRCADGSPSSSHGNGQRHSDTSYHDRESTGYGETSPVALLPSASPSQSGLVECPLCFAELDASYFPSLSTCGHLSCRDCLQQYLRIEISESRVDVACPHCSHLLHPNDMRDILGNRSLMDKYEDFMVRRVLASDPDARWCPAPDCGYAVIASGCASCPKIRCERPGCGSYFCYHCKAEWHPNQTCDAARAQRTAHVMQRMGSNVAVFIGSGASSSVSSASNSGGSDIKTCPRCRVLIVKMDDGSCNHMTCAVCGAEFCWLCMKEISDLHYLSPSGCTFWGKKPWSRKKKILWQLGTLVGAPVGIALVAGIAVPAIVVGVPVWVGRKLYARYQLNDKHKRNLVVTGGVTASVLVSPLLAGLAVAIGVPILLAYVYGVVPISLCRSGGCGVSKSASGGVRFDFHDEDEDGTSEGASSNATAADMQASATAIKLATPGNATLVGRRSTTKGCDAISVRGMPTPSIGEVSLGPSGGGASLSLSIGGSNPTLEKLGRECDRESASNVAIAGSISSAAGIQGPSCQAPQSSHKLEVCPADVSSSKRLSLTSETNVSLSGRSATISMTADDGAASTRALAGSVLSYKIGDSASASREGVPLSATAVDIHVVSSNSPNPSSSSDGTNSPKGKRSPKSFSFLRWMRGNASGKSHPKNVRDVETAFQAYM